MEEREEKWKSYYKVHFFVFCTQTKKEDLNKQLFNQAAVIEPNKLFSNVTGTTGVTKERRRYGKF